MRPAVIPNSISGNAYRSRFYQLHPGVVVDVVNEGPACRKVRIKVADYKCAHCAVRDRIEDGLAYRGRNRVSAMCQNRQVVLRIAHRDSVARYQIGYSYLQYEHCWEKACSARRARCR